MRTVSDKLSRRLICGWAKRPGFCRSRGVGRIDSSQPIGCGADG